MDMYKSASKLKLKYITTKGVVEINDLWDFTLVQLETLIKSINRILKQNNNDDGLSFLSSTTIVDVENQLRFDIAKDIYLTKKQENEERLNEIKIREHNRKIDELISKKKEQKWEELSIEELEKARK